MLSANKTLKLATGSSDFLEKLLVPLLVKKFSAFYVHTQLVAVFTTDRIYPDDYPVYARPVLILYSPLSLVDPRYHSHSISPPKPISVQSLIFHSCRSILLSACKWRSHSLELCEYHKYNYIS